MRAASLLTVGAVLGSITAATAAPSQPADLREFRVGMPLSALPAEGYVGFNCAAVKDKPIAGWADYLACPAGDTGLRAVGFHYASDDGTKVAGQPMLLSLLLRPDGQVEAIQMQTDPSARLFQRKRGFLFGEQVKARYGEPGWSCTEGEPTKDEELVGGVFVMEHCEKAIGERHLVVDRALYQPKGQAESAFVSRSQFTVSLAGEP